METIAKKFIGSVYGVRGQIVLVHCEGSYRPMLQEVLGIEGEPKVSLEVHSYYDRDILRCLLLSSKEKLQRGMKVFSEGTKMTIPIGNSLLGRAIDLYGQPIDGGKPLVYTDTRPIQGDKKAPSIRQRATKRELLETGIKIIDFFTPLVRGGKLGLIGGAGVGKTTLMTEIIRNLNSAHKGVTLFAGIGERIREGHELLESLKETGTLSKTALIVAHINENAAIRFKVGAAAATLAEYFRDEEKKDVLFFADNIFRFVQAGSELATLLEEIQSEFGYQSTLQTQIAQFENRLVSRGDKSITSIQTVYVPADQLTNPSVAASLPYFEAAVVLSREMSQEGRYPAVDLLNSKSSVLDRSLLDDKHYRVLTEAVELLNQYDRLSRIVTIIGEGELSAQDRLLYERALRLRNYMTQPFFTQEIHSGKPGTFVHQQDVVNDVGGILEGKFDTVQPEKFMYIGTIKDLIGKE